jgi:hypothetical protein
MIRCTSCSWPSSFTCARKARQIGAERQPLSTFLSICEPNCAAFSLRSSDLVSRVAMTLAVDRQWASADALVDWRETVAAVKTLECSDQFHDLRFSRAVWKFLGQTTACGLLLILNMLVGGWKCSRLIVVRLVAQFHVHFEAYAMCK